MNKISFVKDINTSDIHSVVVFNDYAAKSVAVDKEAVAWAHWVNDSRATFQDIKNVLDVNLQQEAPIEITGKTLATIAKTLPSNIYQELENRLEDDVFIQDGSEHPTMGSRFVAKGVKRQTFDATNLRNTRIASVPARHRQNLINYKARQFRTEQKITSMRIQVKRVRAIFDPNVGPGGGWRCPEGTLYGGQITDRFGRGCGGGLTRRLGRALMRAGRRLDVAGAARDSRRMARRVQAATNRNERRERIRAGRVRIANRLDDAAARLVGDFAPARDRRERIRRGRERVADRLDDAADRIDGGAGAARPRRRTRMVEPAGRGEGGRTPNGRRAQNFEILPGGERGRRWRDLSDDELQAALDDNDPARFDDPDTKERISANRDNIRREIDRRVREPQARRRPGDAERRRRAERQAPRLRPPARSEGETRPARGEDDGSDPFDFIEDPKTREVVREALGEYADDIANLIRNRRRGERRRRGADAPDRGGRGEARGDRPETEEEQKSLLRRILEALARAFQKFQEARENRRQGRDERRDRRRERRVRLADALDNAANRILDEEVPSARRRRGERDSAERRRVNQRAAQAAEKLDVVDVNDDPEMRRRYAEERGIPENLGKLNDEELKTILGILDDEERQAGKDPDGFDPFRATRREQRRRLRAEMRRRKAAPERERGGARPEVGANAPGLGDLTDDQIAARLRRFRDPRAEFPFDLNNLSDDDLLRLKNIVDTRPEFRDIMEPGGMYRPNPVNRIYEEVNRRNDNGLWENLRNVPEGPSADGDLGGSKPDSRSLRNVRNRFPRNGLPDRAFWREEGWQGRDENDREQHERRFGRYYDDNGDINARGRYVNRKLQEERDNNGRDLNDAEREDVVRNAENEFERTEGTTPPGAPEGAAPTPPRPRGPRGPRRQQANVPQRGLPRRANWRDRNRPRYNEAAERDMDARFGRYYDENGNLNERGRFVNDRVRSERNNLGRPLTTDERNAVEDRANQDFDRQGPEERVRTSELDGSRPDDRSLRNVRNQFRSRGLPPRPSWRNRNDRRYSPEREREMDRRFGRYYDANGELNARGRYVNQRLAEERRAQGGQIDDAQAEQVIRQADNQFDRNNPVNVPSFDNIDVNQAVDDAIVDATPDVVRAEMRQLAQNIEFEAALDVGDENTPAAVGQAERRVAEYIAQQRLAIAKLRAADAGQLEMSDEEKQRLSNFIYALEGNLSPLLGDSNLFNNALFGENNQWLPVGGGVIRLGILDPRFDGDARAAFFRTRFGAYTGMRDGLRRRSFEGLQDAVQIADALNDPLPRNLVGRGDLNDAELVELATALGRKSIRPTDISSVFIARTGLSETEAKSIVRSYRSLQNSHVKRVDAIARARTATDRDSLRDALLDINKADKQGTDDVVALWQTFSSARAARAGNLNADASAFQEQLNRQIGGMGDQLAMARVNAIAGEAANPVIGAPNALSLQRGAIEQIHSLLDPPEALWEVGLVGLRKRREVIANILAQNDLAATNALMGLNGRPGDDPMSADAGMVLIQNVRQNAFARDRLTANLREMNNRLGLPNDNIPGHASARNARQADDAANGVVDRYADTEVAQVIGKILTDAKAERRKRLSNLYEATYGDKSIIPWKRRRAVAGEPPIDPRNIKTKAEAWSRGDLPQEEVANIKDFVTGMYKVKYEKDGIEYHTEITQLAPEGGKIHVEGLIYAKGPNGRDMRVGSFSRYLGYDGDRSNGKAVYSSLLSIGLFDMRTNRAVEYTRDRKYVYSGSQEAVPADALITRNNGFATAFNNHAWGWARDAGFTQVNVRTGLDDGPYVWGRVGYREGSDRTNRTLWDTARVQVAEFRQGRTSIVKNEKQAQLIEFLAAEAANKNYDWKSSPDRMELIYALEHSPQGSAKDREREVRNWVQRNLYMSTGVINLASWDISADYDELTRKTLTGNPVPARLDPRLGDVAEPAILPGDLPTPRVITNGQITSAQQAIDFVRTGGSLGEVPNEYWFDAMKANASTNETDTTKPFYMIVPDEGAIATTRIFVLRNDDGTPSGQGWVVKASRPRGTVNDVYDDTWSEVVGWNLAQAIGLTPQGAMYGGLDENGRQRVIVPLGSNSGPQGERLRRAGGQSFNSQLARNAVDGGYPSRLLHFYQNFFLGAKDRNWGNGITYVDSQNRLYAIPLDYARIARASENTLDSYVRTHWLDGEVLNDLRNRQRALSAEAREASKKRILAQYDDMVSRYRTAIAGGRDEFIRRMSIGASDAANVGEGINAATVRKKRLGKAYDVLKDRLDRAQQHRLSLEQYL